MKGSYLLLALSLFCISFGLLLSCGDDDDDGNDSNEDENDVICTITGAYMTEIPAQVVSDNCGSLGLTILLDHVFVNPTMTIFEAQGQYVITNENTYYLRGNGPTDNLVCYDKLNNAGDFSVFTESLNCTNMFALDIITYPEEEANAFCQISIQVNLDCNQIADDDENNDDDDDDDDDDSGHTETEEELCEYIVNVCNPSYYESLEACYDEDTGYVASCHGNQEAFLNCARVCRLQDSACTENIFRACEEECFLNNCSDDALERFKQECIDWYEGCTGTQIGAELICAWFATSDEFNECIEVAIEAFFNCLTESKCDFTVAEECLYDLVETTEDCSKRKSLRYPG